MISNIYSLSKVASSMIKHLFPLSRIEFFMIEYALVRAPWKVLIILHLPPILINALSFMSFTYAVDSHWDMVVSLFNTT